MCADGVDLGWSCRLCGRPLLSCWDDGPSISWHMNAADALACMEECRRTSRQWLSGPPPCGISHADIYNPCMPERDERGLRCVMCGLRQRLAILK